MPPAAAAPTPPTLDQLYQAVKDARAALATATAAEAGTKTALATAQKAESDAGTAITQAATALRAALAALDKGVMNLATV